MSLTITNANRTDSKGWLVVEFLRPTFVWAGALTLIATTWNVVNFPNVNLRPGHVEALMVGMFSTFLTVTTFAGGLTMYGLVRHSRAMRSVLFGGLAATLLSFSLGSYVEPHLRYRSYELGEFDLETVAPFGPRTPSAVLRQLRSLRANAQAEQQARVESRAPVRINWTEFRFHSHFVVPLYSLLSGFAGLLCAQITAPIRSSRRRHVRWLLALVVMFAVTAPLQPIRRYLFAQPSASGAMGAWLMLTPLLFVLLLVGLGTRVTKTEV